MENLKEFEAIEQDAIDSPVKDIKWYGKDDRTENELLHDRGVGDIILIRTEDYALSPTLENLPTKEQLLTPEYLRDAKARLWGDGLRLVLDPRVEVTKERCRVFFPCVAATGNSFLEQPKLLQEYL